MNKKDEQLGMSFGKAAHLLRQQIFFQLVQQANRDICAKCNKVIKVWNELSIEHLLPWFGNDTNLFWNLNNIAFSHRACNRPHKKVIPKNKVICPEGQSWCSCCKEFKDVSNFHKSKGDRGNFFYHCKDCRKGENHWRNKKKRFAIEADMVSCTSL